MYARENALKEWIEKTIEQKDFILTALAGDASFRRYFRLHFNELTYVVMDAPPDKEDIEPFIYIAQVLEKAGVHAPQILAINREQGFLLLSDLGDRLLLNALNAETCDLYYHEALKTLLQIQLSCDRKDPRLSRFDSAFMMKEMSLCPEWFLKAYLKLDLNQEETHIIEESLEWIAAEVAKQPLSFIHRDYHSRNLMLLSETGEPQLGVIDFQDAMCGPFTYDLVSLLKDCYISWPRERILEWVRFFYTQNPKASEYSLEEFIRAFDLCGVQRHLKVLGVFSRLYLRDHKAGYLKDLPLTLNYVLESTQRYEALQPLFYFLKKRVNLP